MSTQFKQIGVIVKPHGLKGAVVCLIESAYVSVFSNFQEVFIEQHATKVPYLVSEIASLTADRFKLHVEGIQSKDEAEALRGNGLFQYEKNLPQIATVDWKGFSVKVEGYGHLGKVYESIENKAQVLIDVHEGDNNWLIPLVEEFIISIDMEQRSLHMRLPDGMIEL